MYKLADLKKSKGRNAMKDKYIKLAECYENLAKCYRSLAGTDNSYESLKEKSLTSKDEYAVDITDVRKVLAEKVQAGKGEEVRELLLKYGAKKLSAIHAEQLPKLLAEAEGL